MDNKQKFNIDSTRFEELKRLEIGDQVYLISRKGISERDTILFNKVYKKNSDNKEDRYLELKGLYNLKGKLLEVNADNRTGYSPLGSYFKLKACYDGVQIGDFSSFYSYMGGGMNGEWPILKEKEGTLLFFHRKEDDWNEFSIEYYKTLIADLTEVKTQKGWRSIDHRSLPKGILKKEFSFEEVKKYEVVKWLIPVIDKHNNIICILSCSEYPGFAHYKKVYYGKGRLPDDRCFFARSFNGEHLHTLTLEFSDGKEVLFPWEELTVRCDI